MAKPGHDKPIDMNPKRALAALRLSLAGGEVIRPEALLPSKPVSEALACDAARALAQSHYENFSVLSQLVPADLVDDFAAAYAFCRWADDLADETGADDDARQLSLDLLAWWRTQTDACFDYAQRKPGADAPKHPVFIALAATAQRRSLPSEPFHDLINAFEQDQRVTRYATWTQLLDYCKGSANPVGRIVLALAGHTGDAPGDDARFAMSDATCTALQLTNFWQDVRRDLAERDRIYMPSDLTGVTADTLRDWLARPTDPAARVPFIKALRPLVERTHALFDAGADLPKRVDPCIAPVVWLFGAGGRSALRAVERTGCTTLWNRPRLSHGAKIALVGSAWTRARFGRAKHSAAPTMADSDLVRSAAAEASDAATTTPEVAA